MRVIFPSVFIGLVFLIISCSSQPATLESPQPEQIDCNSQEFLISNLGKDYFHEYFDLLHEEVIGDDLVKATFEYTFQPYVESFQMTMFLDTNNCQLSDQEVSMILLEPQILTITAEEAIDIAIENGLAPTGRYDTRIILNTTTKNRFAWEVISPDAEPTSQEPEPIIFILLDAEGGQVYSKEIMKPMEAHDSPF